ncbi:MAG: hypothetical protein KKD17_04260 [Nanoarchaeota archaeon]|nr:hypothetical protein [Nanoarchaeota archaeon]
MDLKKAMMTALALAGCTQPNWPNTIDLSRNPDICSLSSAESAETLEERADCSLSYDLARLRFEYEGRLYDINTSSLTRTIRKENIATGETVTTSSYEINNSTRTYDLSVETVGGSIYLIGLEGDSGTIVLCFDRDGALSFVTRPPGGARVMPDTAQPTDIHR